LKFPYYTKSNLFFAKGDVIIYFYRLKIKVFSLLIEFAGVAEPAYRQAGW
jgi:hypothetical protein